MLKKHDKFSMDAAARGVLSLTKTHHAPQMLGNPVVVVAGIISAASLSAAGLPRTDHRGRLLNVTSLKETRLKFQFNNQVIRQGRALLN